MDASERRDNAREFSEIAALMQSAVEPVRLPSTWSDPAMLAAVRQEAADEIPEGWCDASNEEHDWQPGDPECRRCGADLAAWNDEEN